MASKGPRSRLDHETRARRQKALEAPREPPRPKTHWDHVLEEMVWLSKDFESERKWKLAQAKKVALRVSKSILDQPTRGEKKVKEEEQRLRKVALGISKDVKKFWIKIEKLVLYKHQLEVEEKKKKALDKQLDFLLGQTERYSTMLAENLVDMPYPSRPALMDSEMNPPQLNEEGNTSHPTGSAQDPEILLDSMVDDEDYDIHSEDDSEDDEHTIVEDEAHFTEGERREELAALQAESDMPLEELLKNYTKNKVSCEASPVSAEDMADPMIKEKHHISDSLNQTNGSKDVEKLDLARARTEEYYSPNRMMGNNHSGNGSNHAHHANSNGDYYCKEAQLAVKIPRRKLNLKDFTMPDAEYLPLVGEELDDNDYLVGAEEEKDDEATLSEEEALAKKESFDPLDEIKLLQQESDMPIEELLARYKKDDQTDNGTAEFECASASSDDEVDSEKQSDSQQNNMRHATNDAKISEHKEFELEECTKEMEVNSDKRIDGMDNENIIAGAAAVARSAQPTGNTFSTTKVRTKCPFLLKHSLREYQHIGLDWLVTMYEKRLNGILADEMGLGKTIMTIALLAHLACEKGIWGPHLIVVPTSVMLNWETEFLKWCPAFKILTYFGSAKERKHKRQGWLKPNYFHICITTYRLVIQDSKVFKRKKWKYLILDEAHLIKNWKSQRWQTLLNFNSKRRILLTGTPLQNDLMELWSLMHFLMPHVFQSHQEFKDWFCNPISGMVDGQDKVNKEVVDRLHNVLRPFLLRRLKRDVEKQLPQKREHVIYCRLSRRQRNLYEDFIASSETQATLSSTNYFGMISVIMQLRKVCNHPDLFEGRPIISSFDMAGINMQVSSSIGMIHSSDPFSGVDLRGLNFLFTQHEFDMTSWEIDEVAKIASPFIINVGNEMEGSVGGSYGCSKNDQRRRIHGANIFEDIQKVLLEERAKESKERAASISWWNSLRCQKKPVYGTNIRELVTIKHPVFDILEQKSNHSCYMNYSSKLADIVLSPVEQLQKMRALLECFMFAIPASRAPSPVCWCSKGRSPVFLDTHYKEKCTEILAPLLSPIRPAIVRRQVYFPDRRLIQFDCGKLQELAVLLRRLKSEGHRALIFTQMTKMLDILEPFINLYGYTYMRLDGSTPPEERQTLMQRFNTNPKIFLFILSTRSGGVGINLVGADTVIFYDSDWNPAMDQQAQDRCHRIGQTREVHIYRLVSESTIEENILKKANQKRALDDLVIQSGSYNTEFFKKLDPLELFSGHGALPMDNLRASSSSAVENSNSRSEMHFSNADVEAAIKDAEDEADYMALKKVEQEEAVDNQEFTEEVVGRFDDDELANDDDIKHDERTIEGLSCSTSIVIREDDAGSNLNTLHEEKVLTLAVVEEDIDMLADVKQMAAAAAAAGQASSSFENHLRPIDRYAMRFLDLWDPIIVRTAVDFHENVEGEEWELDRIEKLKDDLEAEIDEDQEPLVYESWDADFATTAYHQHVEALAQQQLLEQLEFEAQQANQVEEDISEHIRNEAAVQRKPKSKKKSKKKFKSLKKGPLASESEVLHWESSVDHMSEDDLVLSPEVIHDESPPPSPPKKKRKKVIVASEEQNSRKSFKKLKKAHESNSVGTSNAFGKPPMAMRDMKRGELAGDTVLKPASRSKTGGKISITVMPVKRVMVVKPERLRKRGNLWSKDFFPSPDTWASQEDTLLCAAVHEYGTNWSFVSDILYDSPCGGSFRGRYRHPVHCCERFRELFHKYVLSSVDGSSTEKAASSGSGKALLKVTEDHVRLMLNVTSDLPDNEMLLQNHFVAIISSVWRTKWQQERHKNKLPSQNSFYPSSQEKPRKLTDGISSSTLRECSKLVMKSLDDIQSERHEEPVVRSNNLGPRSEGEQVEVTVEFPMSLVDDGSDLVSAVSLTVQGVEPSRQVSEQEASGALRRNWLTESSYRNAENRFRAASSACFDGEGQAWASSAFPVCDNKNRSGSKTPTLGKHKAGSDLGRPPKSKAPRTTEPSDNPALAWKSFLPPPNQSPAQTYDVSQFISDPWNDGHYSFPGLDAYLYETESRECVMHEFDPSLCDGLEDPGSPVEIIDIG